MSKSKAIADVIRAHVDACCAEIRAEVEREFAQAIAALAPGTPAKPRRVPQERAKAPRRAKPAAPGDRRGKSKAGASSKARTCGCGPVGRHRRECKLATGTGPRSKAKPKADDEDSGAARAAAPARDPGPDRGRRLSRAVEPAPELPVIPRSQLIARLRADRDVTGDAGGVVLRGGPSLVGHVEGETREVCPLHGWVGRRRFVEDGHAWCAQLPKGAEPCPVCHGKRFIHHGACERCDGTGIAPPPRAHHAKDNAPHDAAEGATS